MKIKLLHLLSVCILIIATGSIAQSPGNVSINIELWLKANAGARTGAMAAVDGGAVNTWQDQSGARTNDATDANLAAPTYRESAADVINYNPVIDFDGTDDGLDYGNDYIFSSGVGDEGALVFFSVIEPDNNLVNVDQYIYDFGLVPTDGYGFYYSFTNARIYSPTGHFGAQSAVTAHGRAGVRTLTRHAIEHGNEQNLFLDGAGTALITNVVTFGQLTTAEIAESAAQAAGDGPFTIGQQSTTNVSSLFDGSIAEIVGYNHFLNATEIRQVETYLCVKYSITRDNTGGGILGDYEATDGTLLWDASTSATYHNNIIGIGRDDNEELDQKQSHTIDDTSRIYIDALQALNSANTGAIAADVTYVVIGDNQGQMCATAASNAEMPIACGLYSRLEREWQVNNTGFNQNFNFDFKLNGCAATGSVAPANLRFIVDDDGDFSAGTTTCYANGDGSGIVISYAAPVVTVSNVSPAMIPINSTRYVTLGSINVSTPLPIDLASFSATPVNGRYVELDWTTASELNNDYFTLERSTDGKEWKNIAVIEGAGNSSEELTYTYYDDQPLNGTSYYRLTSTSHDGTVQFSDIEPVIMNQSSLSDIVIYPNPTQGLTQIVSKGIVLYPIELTDNTGRVLTTIPPGKNLYTIDLTEYEAGIYFIRVHTSDETYVYKLMKR